MCPNERTFIKLKHRKRQCLRPSACLQRTYKEMETQENVKPSTKQSSTYERQMTESNVIAPEQVRKA